MGQLSLSVLSAPPPPLSRLRLGSFSQTLLSLIKSPCFAIASVKSSSVLDARVLTDDDDDDENVLGVVVVVVV